MTIIFHWILTLSYPLAFRRMSNRLLNDVSFWNTLGTLKRNCHNSVCSCTCEKKESTRTRSWNTSFWLLGSLDNLQKETTREAKWGLAFVITWLYGLKVSHSSYAFSFLTLLYLEKLQPCSNIYSPIAPEIGIFIVWLTKLYLHEVVYLFAN